MKLSTRVRFGLRIMVQIAAESTEKPVFSRRIAATQHISEAYVDQILLPLRTGGLLISLRGRSGGYRLSRPAQDITVLDVVRVLEGELALVECIGQPATCPRVPICPTRRVWETLTKTITQTLRKITLEELCKDEARLKASVDYSI